MRTYSTCDSPTVLGKVKTTILLLDKVFRLGAPGDYWRHVRIILEKSGIPTCHPKCAILIHQQGRTILGLDEIRVFNSYW